MGLELKVAERPEITKEMVEQDTRKLAEVIAAACADKKARDIVFMNMEGLSPSTDWFVVCSARSTTQARSIADSVEDKLDELGIPFYHKEGYQDATWVLLDYGDAVCHIFLDESREYYALESLWSEAELIPYEE